MTVQNASTDSEGLLRSDDRGKRDGMFCGRESTVDRRRVCRHAQPLRLTVSVFNQGALFQAQMINYGQDGICAETGQRILPGTSLHLRIDVSEAGALQKAVFPELRTTALGEVKWCRRVIDEESSPRYRFGVRYHSYY